MMQVVIFRSIDAEDLENQVNEWLRQPLIEVLSTSYQMTDMLYSLAIFYKEL